eukprot:5064683-Pyramimonas_sp.AAC.1
MTHLEGFRRRLAVASATFITRRSGNKRRRSSMAPPRSSAHARLTPRRGASEGRWRSRRAGDKAAANSDPERAQP